MIKVATRLFILIFLGSVNAFCQKKDSIQTDSIKRLNEIVVHAYEYDKPIINVPASIGTVSQADLNRFSSTSLLPVFNTIPGVRMEERSPGSYRLSIRGSSLRSPFGVRNIKFYWNDLPFTDPGGNTYLNLIDLSLLQQAEVIKGPGGSIYGAGTGGVVLLKANSPTFNTKQINISQTFGCFGLMRFTAGYGSSDEHSSSMFQYAHQETSGYRDQSKMKRDVFLINEKLMITPKQSISFNMLFANMFYETPGGLTKREYDSIPASARPNAANQKAAIFNKTVYMGLSHEYEVSSRWSNRTGVYGSFTKFENPTIRSTEFERKTEQSIGARTVTQYKSDQLKISIGGECQYGFTPSRTYQNIKGKTGLLQTDTETLIQTGFLFSQLDWDLPGKLFLTVGGSYNLSKMNFTNFITVPAVIDDRKFSSVISPRITVLKSMFSRASIYASFSQGFSPPTKDDLYPSNKIFNKTLNAEKGNNFEIGVKGNLMKEALQFGISAYSFTLKNTIVSRRDTINQGAEYYVNAGGTLQKGLEVNVSWLPANMQIPLFKNVKLWTSYTLNNYTFHNYYKGDNNFSGKKLTGTPKNMVSLGLDLNASAGFYSNITLSYTDKIPLDDANTTFASAYTLLNGRIGYRNTILKKHFIDIFSGVDNALNQHYSLGNDLNAVASTKGMFRYYNPAPTINFYIGVSVKLATPAARKIR